MEIYFGGNGDWMLKRFYRHFWSEAVHDRRNRMAMKKNTTNPPVLLEVCGVMSMKRIDMYICISAMKAV